MITSSRVAVLVHGTFSPNSAWTLPDSRLCAALEEAGFDTILRFTWTGHNTVSARTQAAGELASQLQFIRDESADAEIVIVSHSHGGNIALHAINDSDVTVAGLVTMATPFFHADTRLPQSAWLACKGLFVIAAALAIIYILLQHPPFWTFVIVFLVVPLAILIASMGFLIFVSTPLAEELWPQLVSPSPHCPVLAIRMTGDEASAALIAFQFLNWVTSKVSFRLDAISERFSSYGFIDLFRDFRNPDARDGAKRRLPFALLGAIMAGALWYVALGLHQDSLGMSERLKIVSGLFLGIYTWDLAMLFFGDVLAVLLIAPVAVAAVTLWSVGPEVVLAAPMLSVSIEQVPVGSMHSIFIVPPPEVADITLSRPMVHSLIWEDSTALSVITEWLRRIPGRTPDE